VVSQLRENKTQYAVLGMLSFGSKSGYETAKAIRNNTNYFWSESDGQLYPILKQLTENGLVKCVESKIPEKHSKKIYEITAEGQAVLMDWLQRQPITLTTRNEFLLQLFFGHHLSTTENMRKIKDLKQQLMEAQALYNSIEVQPKEKNNHSPYILMSLAYEQHTTKAKIAWCDEMIQQLEHQGG
jgi:DNA-binding PadR family transcriptional regulator